MNACIDAEIKYVVALLRGDKEDKVTRRFLLVVEEIRASWHHLNRKQCRAVGGETARYLELTVNVTVSF